MADVTLDAACPFVSRVSMPSAVPLTPGQIETIHARTDVSTRTVRRYLAGAPVHGSTMKRVETALRAEGWEHAIEARAERVEHRCAAATRDGDEASA